jgi:hypothetical protein
MVIPGVIGQVVVSFHDMHAGESSFQGALRGGNAFAYSSVLSSFVSICLTQLCFSREGHDAH